MSPHYWPWIGFHLFLIIALAIDLGVFHRDAHEVKFKEAFCWSAIWFSFAILFNGGIWYFKGQNAAMEFLAGYLIEWSLSVDNLFVFLTIFTAFSVPKKQQHKVLFWGILGALFMRAFFIMAGITLLTRFHWIMYIFGGFLLFTGIKMLFVQQKEDDPRNHWLVKTAKKVLPMADSFHGGKFFVRENAKLLATPLFLVLIIVEATDVLFAADSIPAVLAISKDPFIIYTSNVFAILGLRSLYFALAGMMALFKYLHFGLAGVLIFVGIKLAAAEFIKVPISLSLMVIGILLGTSIVFSILKQKREVAEIKHKLED